jgi:hypothetical protein
MNFRMSLAYHPKGVVVAISPGAKLHGERARAPWMTLIGHCYIDDEVPEPCTLETPVAGGEGGLHLPIVVRFRAKLHVIEIALPDHLIA